MAPSDLASFLKGEEVSSDPRVDHGADDARQQSPPTPDRQAARDVVRFDDRFEIRPQQPVPEFASVTAMAFAAKDRSEPAAEMIAYVCQTGLPPRWDIVASLKGMGNPAALRLVHHGVVDWPLDNAKRPVILFTRPSGNRVVKSLQHKRDPMGADQVTRTVTLPLARVLEDLRTRCVFHGAINPVNMFLADENGAAKAQLGECVTAPPGYSQPMAFETIERAMADPTGRGVGSEADDLYALGVTILFMLLGHAPAGHLDDQTLLAQKQAKGSFHALIGDARLPVSAVELPRGLLADDPGDRWTLTDLDNRLGGRRISVKQSQAPLRAARPIAFDDGEYWTTRSLSVAMAKNFVEADRLIEGGELSSWAKRSLDDDSTTNHIQEAQRTAATGRSGSIEARRVARVLMALDPPAPIRYKDRAVMPAGIGDAIAETMARGASPQVLAEIISAQLPLFWFNLKEKFLPDFVSMTTMFDRCQTFLDTDRPGFGIERCLYELNQSMPCASPLVERFYVSDLVSLLNALEKVAEGPERPSTPIDRHILAFILCRRGRSLEKLKMALAGDPRSAEYALSVLDFFVDLQIHTRVEKLPRLCDWVASLLEPAINKLHSRTLRKKVRESILRQAQTGQFRNVQSIIANPGLQQRDALAFRAAQQDFVRAELKIRHREHELRNRNSLVMVNGRQMAALIGSVLAAVVVFGVVIMSAG